jgi:hypothetical protein
MTRPIDLMRQGRKEELWQMCCGFLELSLEEFMTIQRRLLFEQIQLLRGCSLGRKLMQGAMPETIQEFREQVPLTTYPDYVPDLTERREDGLPARPAMWVHTVGRIGEYNFKWVPLPGRFLEEFEKVAGGVGLLASCDSNGKFLMKQHLRTLATMASYDYGSGIVAHLMQQSLGFDLLPADAADMTFRDKMEAGFEEALSKGLDALGGLPSILAFVGEMFRQGDMKIDSRFLLSHPRAAPRVTRALVRSKLARRAMLPKDLWSVKVVVGGGADSAVFRDKVKELWGREFLEIYGATEGGIYATQTWDHAGMTFIPNLNFFEFIPEREWFKWHIDHSYQPKTILLDEVKAGENYEIVLTNFHGGILTRYRLGDMIKITSLRNDRLGIDIPQMVFHSRADDFVDVTSLGRLTERMIWDAVENAGIPIVDWVARKEAGAGRSLLHLYVELEGGYVASKENVAAAIRAQFRKADRRHRCNLYNLIGDMETMLDLKTIEITLLPQGSFASYSATRRSQDIDINHVKGSHMNPSEDVLAVLTSPRVVVEAVPATDVERVRTT